MSITNSGRFRRWGLFPWVLMLWGSLANAVSEASLTLTLGVFPRFNHHLTYQRFAPLADYLERALGRPVELVVTKDFTSFWREVESGRFDLVHYNQYHYIRSHKEQGYRAIAANEEGGTSQIHSVLMVPHDSKIESVEQLRGKRILFGGGRSAMMSYIVPRGMLQRAGLNSGDYEAMFALNPPNAALSMQTVVADAATVGSACIEMSPVGEKLDKKPPRIIARSEEMTHLPWAVSKQIETELRDKLRKLLTELRYSERGREILDGMGMTGLIPVEDGDYDHHRQLVRDILGEHY